LHTGSHMGARGVRATDGRTGGHMSHPEFEHTISVAPCQSAHTID